MKYGFEKEKLIIEGAAVLGIAALMNNIVENIGQQVVIIISSRNVNINVLQGIISGTAGQLNKKSFWGIFQSRNI